MDVEIRDLVSTVRAVDGDTLVAPQTLAKIVGAVMKAVEAREDHKERTRAEQQVTPGVSAEQERSP